MKQIKNNKIRKVERKRWSVKTPTKLGIKQRDKYKNQRLGSGSVGSASFWLPGFGSASKLNGS